jgi:hypothetical protein
VTLKATGASAKDSFEDQASILVVDLSLSTSVQLSPALTNTTEAGGSSTIYVTLTRAISSPVTITSVVSDINEATLEPTHLVLQPADYLKPVPIVITGVNDYVADGDKPVTVTLSWTLLGTQYTAATTVYNEDDDRVGFDALPSQLVVNETGAVCLAFIRGIVLHVVSAGTIDLLPVALSSQPLAPVTVTVTSGAPDSATVSPATLVFDATNWNRTQLVTVTGTLIASFTQRVIF